jgi:hypothetical protein
MSWGTGFAASLSGGHGELKVLVGPLGAPIVTLGPDELVGDVVVAGGGLRLRQWQTSAPQLRVRVHGTALRLAAIRAVLPGATVQLQLTTSAGTERVFAGRLRETLTPRPGLLELVADSAEVFVQSRYAATAYRDGLWQSVIGTATTTSSFTPGDATMNIGTPAAAFSPGPSGTQWLLIRVDTGSSSYYLAADTHAVGYVGGVIVLQWDAVTAPSPIPITTVVTYGPLVVGSPIDVLLRVLTSTGAGTNGAYDVLPDGLAIPAGLVDTADAATFAAQVGALGAVDWFSFGATVKQQEPEGGQLLAWAAHLGVWLCQRQGALTIRAAVDMQDASTWAAGYVGDVTDEVLLQAGVHTTRAPDAIPEHLGIKLDLCASSTAARYPYPILDWARALGDPPRSQPTGPSDVEVTCAAEIVPLAGIPDEKGVWTEHYEDAERRLMPWWGRQVEAVEVVLSGEACGWCTGDLVAVTSAAIPGPVSTGGVAVGRRALWAPNSWDWTARQVAGTLYLLGEP